MERKASWLERVHLSIMFRCIANPVSYWLKLIFLTFMMILQKIGSMPDAHSDESHVVHEGWLLKSREPLMKLPFIRVGFFGDEMMDIAAKMKWECFFFSRING